MKNHKRIYYTSIAIFFILSACHSVHKAKKNFDTIIDYSDTAAKDNSNSFLSNQDTAELRLRNKYASMLGISPKDIINIKLYKFIDQWLGTRYLWGGTTHKGIDCSAFVQRLYADVYDIEIPRTSIEQFFTNDVEPFGHAKYLSEGDMVFFKTSKRNIITHVGVKTDEIAPLIPKLN